MNNQIMRYIARTADGAKQFSSLQACKMWIRTMQVPETHIYLVAHPDICIGKYTYKYGKMESTLKKNERAMFRPGDDWYIMIEIQDRFKCSRHAVNQAVKNGMLKACVIRGIHYYRGTVPQKFVWSHDFEACTACGTTQNPHHAQGWCNNCYASKLAENRRRIINAN